MRVRVRVRGVGNKEWDTNCESESERSGKQIV